jgi:hypothetical protein
MPVPPLVPPELVPELVPELLVAVVPELLVAVVPELLVAVVPELVPAVVPELVPAVVPVVPPEAVPALVPEPPELPPEEELDPVLSDPVLEPDPSPHPETKAMTIRTGNANRLVELIVASYEQSDRLRYVVIYANNTQSTLNQSPYGYGPASVGLSGPPVRICR